MNSWFPGGEGWDGNGGRGGGCKVSFCQGTVTRLLFGGIETSTSSGNSWHNEGGGG